MGCGASARQTAVSDDGGLPMKEVESWGHDQVLQEYCKDEFVLNFEPLKDLWFQTENISKGRSLVLTKDCINSYSKFIMAWYQKFAGATRDMTWKQCLESLKAAEVDFEEDTLRNHFFEVVGYPEDEEDETEVAKLKCSPGDFACVLVRIANSVAIQNSGADNSGLQAQFVRFLATVKIKLGGTLEQIFDLGPDKRKIRDESFFLPPKSFIGSEKIVYLTIGTGKEDVWGKVKIRLDTEVTPVTSYNFYSLCLGNRGNGELTGKPLTFANTCFHRIVEGSFVQGGDITIGDGYGGESVYGGEFNDENFNLKHENGGVVSSANNGPNTNSSQFFITTSPQLQLDGENVVFGNVVEGLDIIKRVENDVATDEDDCPLQKIFILDCGEVSKSVAV